jgi:hypothetical protein
MVFVPWSSNLRGFQKITSMLIFLPLVYIVPLFYLISLSVGVAYARSVFSTFLYDRKVYKRSSQHFFRLFP